MKYGEKVYTLDHMKYLNTNQLFIEKLAATLLFILIIFNLFALNWAIEVLAISSLHLNFGSLSYLNDLLKKFLVSSTLFKTNAITNTTILHYWG